MPNKKDDGFLLLIDKDGSVYWGTSDLHQRANLIQEQYIKIISDIAIMAYRNSVKKDVSKIKVFPANVKIQ